MATFVVSGNLKDSHVGEHVVFGTGHETFLFVEDGTHVFVGTEQTLHQQVAFAFVNQGNSFGTGLGLVSFLNQFELVDIDAFLSTDVLDGLDIADKCTFDNTQIDGVADGSDGVRVVSISTYKSFFTFALGKVNQLV